MKREIKFRGKRVDNNEWVYGYLYQSEKESWITDSRNINLSTHRNFAWFQVISRTIGQFTGLKDKNSVEIYEGDILHNRYDDELEADGYGEVYNEVVFKDGAFGVMGEITNDFLSFSCNPIITEVVAGNIHDYPELLK